MDVEVEIEAPLQFECVAHLLLTARMDADDPLAGEQPGERLAGEVSRRPGAVRVVGVRLVGGEGVAVLAGPLRVRSSGARRRLPRWSGSPGRGSPPGWRTSSRRAPGTCPRWCRRASSGAPPGRCWGCGCPGVMFWVVIPPASARANAGSPESSPSIARAWALIGTESSLLLAPVAGRFRTLKPVWEWVSMSPGMDASPGGVEDLRLRRNGDVRAHRLDLPVADQHRAARNRVRTHRVHQPAGDGDQVRVGLVPRVRRPPRRARKRRGWPREPAAASSSGRRLYQRPRRLGGVRFRFPGGVRDGFPETRRNLSRRGREGGSVGLQGGSAAGRARIRAPAGGRISGKMRGRMRVRLLGAGRCRGGRRGRAPGAVGWRRRGRGRPRRGRRPPLGGFDGAGEVPGGGEGGREQVEGARFPEREPAGQPFGEPDRLGGGSADRAADGAARIPASGPSAAGLSGSSARDSRKAAAASRARPAPSSAAPSAVRTPAESGLSAAAVASGSTAAAKSPESSSRSPSS